MSAKSQGLYKSVETLWVKHNQLEARLAVLENAIKLDDMLELANRVTALEGKPAPAPTKRQQVAEAFLAAALQQFPSKREYTYAFAAKLIDKARDEYDSDQVFFSTINIMLMRMKDVLEQAAREEQDA